MELRRLTLAGHLIEEAWSAWGYRHLPVSWWPVGLCHEPPAGLS